MPSAQSPPLAQDEDDSIMTDFLLSSRQAEVSDSTQATRAIASHSSTGGASSTGSATDHGAPGSGWQTKKAQEDFERFVGQVLDPHWSMSQFADPLTRK